jgi:hypothetical protein
MKEIIRKAKAIPEQELRFHEEDFPLVLSARDAGKFVETIASHPEPTKAARRAAKRFLKDHG